MSDQLFDEFAIDDSFALRFFPSDRICDACRLTFALNDKYFQPAKGGKNGFSNICKRCKRLGLKAIKKPEQTHKKCIDCKQSFEKTIENFYFIKRKKYNNHFMGRCKKCFNTKASEKYSKLSEQEKQRRNRNCYKNDIRREYGITVEQYQKMFDNQNGLCAICLLPCKIKLCIDHKHDETRKIRGLLCKPCNTAIAFLKDSSEIAQRASNYLKEHE